MIRGRDVLRINDRWWGRKVWRRALLWLVVVAALGIGAWASRRWLLLSAADLWIVSDPIGPADAVVVFGGGIVDRPFAAAQYYRQGLVKEILVSNARESPAEKLGVVISDVAATEAVLQKLGTPPTAIDTFGNALASTHQEVLALHAWAETHNLRRIIVPTEIFSTRRVRWMLRRVFGGAFVVRVVALDPPQYSRDDWWRHEEGVVAFNNEIIKYVYYRIKY
jgi:uncharacterized SAM-binding protein YcdF (DUF218 family)